MNAKKTKSEHFLPFLILVMLCSNICAQKSFSLLSPNKQIEVKVDLEKENICYSVSHGEDKMIEKSPIAMLFTDGKGFGINPKLNKAKTNTVNNIINPPIYKKDKIIDNYNELILQFSDDYNLIFRAYDDGIAYRFAYRGNSPLIIKNEIVKLNFPSDLKAYLPYAKGRKEDGTIETQFYSAFQNFYRHINISEWPDNRLAFAPILIEAANGKKLCITEVDLMNYPGMYLSNLDKDLSIEAIFPPYPKKIQQAVRGLKAEVTEREEYIAKLGGACDLPWRVMVISEKDYELADSDMVYKLAKPAASGDYSWIKPGKVAWDWWNDWNVSGVDFESGVNNETYKYYIDFASKNNIEYVILDEGWAVSGEADLFKIVPEIDLKELITYATKKNVGIILWAGYYAFDKDIEGICKHYSAMGVKGFKIDFMDRDDQLMVDFHRRASEITCKYKMLLDIHGTYKPTGLQRTYPNVVNFEGVHGLEEMKWVSDSTDQVTYDVTLPFIRMVAGPVDYTQGAMRNANKKNYRSIYTEPMSQGTRCRQLALYIILESPINMLCDTPTNYMKEQECTDFITAIPTVWNETVALDGKVGEYISMARRKGDVWYVASMTNWDKRQLNLDLSFLPDSNYKVEIFQDGVNSSKIASDYKRIVMDLPASKVLKADMFEGGGYIAKITRK